MNDISRGETQPYWIYSLSHIFLTQGGAISHPLWQHMPLKAGIRAHMINDRDRKGKAGTILRVEGNGKEAIFYINDYFMKVFRNSYWGRQARL